jgi:hypothetical protein
MSGTILDDKDDDDEKPFTSVQGSMVDSLLPDEEYEDFDIVETDDQLNPVEPAKPQQPAAETTPAATVDNTASDDQSDDEHERKRRDRAAERRRRKEGRERTFAENAQLKDEVQRLKEQLEGIAPRLTKLDQERIQDQISFTDKEMEAEAKRVAAAKRRMAEAIQTGDADAHTAALDEWEAAKQRGQELALQKQRLATSVQTPAAPAADQRPAAPQRTEQPRAPTPLPQEAVEFLEDFRANHSWMKFDGQGRPADFDTQLILQLDAQVAAEGFDPREQDYWDELESRGRKYLPQHFSRRQGASPAAAPAAAPQQAADTRRGPKVSGSSERPTGNANNKVYLSPQRKQFLVDAGVLDNSGKNVVDKNLYTRYMRAYQKYDRENGRSN